MDINTLLRRKWTAEDLAREAEPPVEDALKELCGSLSYAETTVRRLPANQPLRWLVDVGAMMAACIRHERIETDLPDMWKSALDNFRLTSKDCCVIVAAKHDSEV